ncbi:MAG TPA: TonB-dependent receptor [Allosphingosinicella sp.]|jgi:outer membrane receptor protein involved in Fe transport
MKSSEYRACGSALALAACLLLPSELQAQAPQGQQPPASPGPAPAPPASPDGPPGTTTVVTGTRSEVIATPDRVSFNVANDLQVQTGTLADALRAVPGVEVDVQGNVSLRGDPGVTILVNGRPSAMLRGDNRGQVILSMPSSQIERVEVITNPSADMSPEGSGGVINLVTRQARPNSRSASVRANLGGEGRGTVNLNASSSADGLTVTGDLGYRRFTGSSEVLQLRSRRDPATGSFIDSRRESDQDSTNTFGSARVAVEYDLDPRNRLSSELGYRRGTGETEIFDVFTGPNAAASFERSSDVGFRQRGLGGRLSWRRTLPGSGHELVADLEAEDIAMRRSVDALTTSGAGQTSVERIRNAIDREDYSLKLDYKRPTGADQSINLGYQGNSRSSAFDFTGAFGPTPNALVPAPGLTNTFAYDERIHAVYGTYRFKLGDLDTQAGLRFEQVDTSFDQITDGLRFERGYFRAYPTLHLNYGLSEEQTLRASYSRRVQRPSPLDLNPYTIYLDAQNLRRGDPNLLPEVTDSFELGVQHRESGTFYSLTGFYRRSTGGVTDIVSDVGGGVFLTTRANLATATRLGAELIANGRLTPTLTYNASATLLRHRIDARIGGVPDPRAITTGTVRANLSWQPSPSDFFQLNANYVGRQLLPQGYRESGPVLNFGYRRKVNDRLSLLVTAQDVLDSGRQEIVFDTPDLRDRVEQRGPGRIVLFGISYNLQGTPGRQRQEPGFDFQQPATTDTPQ